MFEPSAFLFVQTFYNILSIDSMSDINTRIEQEFPDKKIVIVGDIVADQFLRGRINRVSREAPVFILGHEETETLAGGAGNAASNVASLGGKATLIGVIGKDSNGESLAKALEKSEVNCESIVFSGEFATTTKLRVLAGHNFAPKQQVIRIDYENQTKIADDLFYELKQNIKIETADADAIIVSDYNYGVASKEIFALCKKISKKKNVPLVADSRFRLGKFADATTATPNQEEIEQILGKEFSEQDCSDLRENLNLQALLITRGNKGMLLIEKEKPLVTIDIVGSTEPIDVTGAGDTVIAAYALGLASGLSFEDSANLANHAGGIVVMKKRTAIVTNSELLQSIRQNSPNKFRKTN